MKKIVLKLTMLIMMMFTFTLTINITDSDASVTIGGIEFEEVYNICEGEEIAILHTGEDWESNGASNIGVITTQTNTEYKSAYVEMYSQESSTKDGENVDFAHVKVNSGLVAYKGSDITTTFWVSFVNKKTGSEYRYYFYVYKKPTEIKLSDSYLNGNDVIYMYEGDTITTSLSAYINSTKVEKFELSAETCIVEKDDLGIPTSVPTNGATVTKKSGKFSLTAVEEGSYKFGVAAYSDSNCNSHARDFFVNGVCYSETINVIVRKKPNPTMPSEVYMNIDGEKTITLDPGFPTGANTEGVAVEWFDSAGNYMDVETDGFSCTLKAKGVKYEGTVIAKYSDVVIENNPNHDVISLETKVYIEEEDVNITVDGVDILSTPVDITEGTVSAKLECTTSIVDVKSTNENVATVSYLDGILTINKVGAGTTTITITTVTDAVYTVTVNSNASAPVVTADSNSTGTIMWQAVTSAVGYDIYRATSQTGFYTKLGTTTELVYTDETAAYGQTYYYKIIAVTKDATYSSDYSVVVATKKMPTTPVINKIDNSGKQYKVTMSTTGECDGYTVYAGNSANPTSVVGTTEQASATFSLTPGTWYIRVRAYVLVNGEKVYSNYTADKVVTVAQDGTVKPQNPSETTTAPAVTTTAKENITISATKVKKATVAGKKMKLTVKKIKGAKGYQVQIAKAKKFSKKNILVKKTVKKVKSTITSKKLTNKKKLFVRVRVYKVVDGKKVWSKWSKAKKVKVTK